MLTAIGLWKQLVVCARLNSFLVVRREGRLYDAALGVAIDEIFFVLEV